MAERVTVLLSSRGGGGARHGAVAPTGQRLGVAQRRKAVVCASAGGSGGASGGVMQTLWPRVRHFIAGSFSGCALVLAGHPFDTVKVRLQTAPPGKFTGPLHCLRQTVTREGLFALYKGVTPPLVATGVINSVMFGIQGWFVHAIASRRQAVPGETVEATVPEIMVAAVFSGACISLLVAPMEGVKARLQVNYAAAGEARLYSGPVDCVRKLVTGPLGVRRGLYRGWSPACLARMSNWSYFGSYAYFRRAFATTDENGEPQKPTLITAVMAGGLAGLCYWLSCYPLDVIKNRIQAAPDTIPPTYSGMRDAAKEIYAEAGPRGFFKGFVPCVLRAFPANIACFTAFEVVMSLLPESL